MKRCRARVLWTSAVGALVASGIALVVAAPTSAGEPAAPVPVRTGCASVGAYRAPDPGSVGVPPALHLCASGPITVRTGGAVLDGWDVRGGIVVDAPDVTIRRSRVTGDGSSRIGITTTALGSVRIEDSTLTGDFPEAAVGCARCSAERIEISRVVGDGAQLGAGSRLRNSRVHDVGLRPVTGDGRAVLLAGAGDPVLLEDNDIDVGGPSTTGHAVLIVSDPSRPVTGSVVVRGNVLAGGRWTLREDAGGPARVDVLITGNRFRRGGEQGPLRVSLDAVLTDNTYLDGGALPQR
jgi:hypothetical protein